MKPMENSPEMRMRFYKIREAVGVSQREMSKRMGLSSSFYGKLETGSGKITESTLIAIRYIFGVRPEYLYGGKEPIFDQSATDIQEITNIYKILSPAHKKCLLEYSRFLLGRSKTESSKRTDE